MKGEPGPRRSTRAARMCRRCNDILLVVGVLLAFVVTAGQQHPQGFAAIVAHLDWLAPPMDPQTGILLEHAMAGAASLPSDENALPGDARRLAASN